MFSAITNARGLVSGQKTYIVAVFVIAIGVAEGVFGIDIPGAEVGPDWIMYVMNGIGLGTIRAGIAKAALGLA